MKTFLLSSRISGIMIFLVLGAAVARGAAIHDAVKAGDIKRVSALLAADPALIHAEDADHLTPLLCAVDNGNQPMVEFLLTKGSNVNEQASNGLTALHEAASSVNLTHLLRFLIARGADVKAKSKKQYSPLDMAITARNDEGAETLISSGANVNERTPLGYTALYFAAQMENLKLATLLLDHGADVNAGDGAGFTPLNRVALMGNEELVALFLARGADVKKADPGGATALHLAAYRGHTRIAETLIAKGADPQAKDKNGQTPCQVAINSAAEETANFLCQLK